MTTQHTLETAGNVVFRPSGNQAFPPTVIAVCQGNDAESNARLFAAAPELLAALEKALKRLAPVIQGTTDGAPLLAEMRAAIARAEGR